MNVTKPVIKQLRLNDFDMVSDPKFANLGQCKMLHYWALYFRLYTMVSVGEYPHPPQQKIGGSWDL